MSLGVFRHILGYTVTLATLTLCIPDANAQLTFVTTTVDSSGNVGRSASIDVDSHGYPHIAYLQVFDLSNLDLKYASLSATGWEIETAEDELFWASNADLILDAADTPGIGYTGGYANYTTRPAGAWQKYVVDEEGDIGQWASLALDNNDRPHIAYYDVTNGDLRYATLDPLVPTERHSWGSIKNIFH